VSRRYLLALAASLAIACHGNQRPAPHAEPPRTATPQPHAVLLASRLYASDHSSQSDAVRSVVRDSAALAAAWPQLAQGESPAPSVDFSHDVVLIAAMGTQRTGGYAIGIDTIRVQGDTLVAVVRLEHPGAGCMLAQMLTDPIAVVRVAGANHPVVFVDQVVHPPPGRC
jgi:hypothetical protein